ncbi:UDP-2,4-diacetamido-2,4,6-trideoxy-beta-L-altropyranose hydrolase [Agrobacterium sp. rho-13.3]|uniref:UDP-2,4-diacetamido-2,4, 6-trideoxy-beta-L-altropyranose hydrolase n=1 Tax=Agrobacterium sp. rho-13.3 TaxID=3072980 RepID=UPI002A0C8F8F|nr:UDP-2,4-diacetamido-2,4,6-trideoxy-beta-L-altropyranose hydrolase [Agrobacterium sp. rho-13.3]MDX8309891.1 UDP-2,4-diacetamido-2,4,6-trideoxy-beta-L-altropyranose hydrolase [Agrobacterium sp. rho-13.3]
MKVAIRADASLDIGTGHIMRCLTLADHLTSAGAEVRFLCRVMEGNLIDFIQRRNYLVETLPSLATRPPVDNTADRPAHHSWLGKSMEADASDTIHALGAASPDWLIVDHYAINNRWETKLRPHCKNIMVIDDLADRSHNCDILLDQSLGRMTEDYSNLVPVGCRIAAGAGYALLRSEFASLRDESLVRRRSSEVKNILITMGGIDKDNVTSRVMDALRHCKLSSDTRISVVMGGQSPWLSLVREKATTLDWPTEVIVDTQDMARLMSESDVAIGAAGSTSWERCCLGLPSIIMVLAENQALIARSLDEIGAALMVSDMTVLNRLLPSALDPLIEREFLRSAMSEAAAAIVDGYGASRVLDFLEL